MAGTPDRVIDLDGALVVPGFVDAHVHTTEAGLALTGLDLSGTRSLAECLAAIGRVRRRTSRTGCSGGTAGRTPGGRRTGRPPAREVDAAVGDRPRLPVPGRRAFGADQLARWPPRSPTGRGAGRAGRTPARSPSRPTPRSEPLLRRATLDRHSGRARTWRSCVRRPPRTASSRCTSAPPTDDTGRADLAALLALDGPIPVRGYLAAAVTDPEQARPLLADTGAHALGGDLTVDGAIGSRTAALHQPYDDAPGDQRRPVPEPISRSPTTWSPARWPGCRPDFTPSATTRSARSRRRCWRRRAGWGTTPPSGWPAARTGSSTPRWPTTRPSRRSPRPAWWPACSRCSTRPGVGPDGMYAQRLGADRAAAMNPFADHGRRRRRAGLRVGRAGHRRRPVGGGAGGGAPPHARQRAVPAGGVHRAHQGRASGGRPHRPGDRHHRPSARRRTWPSSGR